MAIRKNLTVSITYSENGVEDILLDLKSTNDRSSITIETRGIPKIALDITELQDAFDIVKEFSKENPVEVKTTMEIPTFEVGYEEI